jgi:hypothetical protein
MVMCRKAPNETLHLEKPQGTPSFTGRSCFSLTVRLHKLYVSTALLNAYAFGETSSNLIQLLTCFITLLENLNGSTRDRLA